MDMTGLYRRLLPSPPAIDFGSLQGKQFFREAIQNGNMEGFPRLVSCFQTQSELGLCGLASLSMVLNALAIDPGRKWKGPWRWFDEYMLDYCGPLDKIKTGGISFESLVSLAHCTGAKVEAFHASDSNIDDFRKYVMRCSTSDDCQTGAGHYSPIGGYHAGKDMVLVLDVAHFKYPPFWVSLTHLWEGMSYINELTGKSRGFMLTSRPPMEPHMLYTMSCEHESWISIAKFLIDDVPSLLKSEDVKDIFMILSVIVTSLLSNFEEFIKGVEEIRRREDGCPSLSDEEKARDVVKEKVLKQVRRTRLFKHMASFLSHPSSCEKSSCTCSSTNKSIGIHLLLLSLPSTTWDGITDDKLLREIHDLVSIENLPTLLQEEEVLNIHLLSGPREVLSWLIQ